MDLIQGVVVFTICPTMSQVLLIGGSTGPMLEALDVVGDANDGPLGDVSIAKGCRIDF